VFSCSDTAWHVGRLARRPAKIYVPEAALVRQAARSRRIRSDGKQIGDPLVMAAADKRGGLAPVWSGRGHTVWFSSSPWAGFAAGGVGSIR
jgi:hypothetical protein